MDAQAKKKAFRAKLNASKKRIDSPLVRYNESDQPVCRVCDVVLKSESLWPAHQVSRKHHEAINKVKDSAAGKSKANNVKTESPKTESPKELPRPEASSEPPKVRSSSELPPGFFDNAEKKRQKTGIVEAKIGSSDSYSKPGGSAPNKPAEPVIPKKKIDALSNGEAIERRTSETHFDREHGQISKKNVSSEQQKGALPEGFFDNKDADLRARGITPVKLDAKDEYKEFEKLIQEDLQVVDNRMEEEEIDAAETIEEAETVEQKICWERVEMLRKKKMEIKAARSSTNKKERHVLNKQDSSSSDSDSDDDNLIVDWRAKHM